jgi:predicted PurR-regulated permease PerM
MEDSLIPTEESLEQQPAVQTVPQAVPHTSTRTQHHSHHDRERTQKSALGQLLGFVQKYATRALDNILEMAITTLEGMIYVITTVVIVFYLLLDGRRLKDGLAEMLPDRIRDHTLHFLESTHRIFYHFIKGQVVLAFLAGIYMYTVYEIYGFKYAGLLGFLFGAASVLPVVGPWVGLLPALLVVMLGSDPTDMIGILMLAGVYYILKEYWLTRKIMGDNLEIHPVVVILAFLASIRIAGLPGVLLAFPLASLLCASFQYFHTPVTPDGEAGNAMPNSIQ